MGRQETCEIPHAPTGAHAGEERRLIKCSRPDGLPPSSSGALRRPRTEEGRVGPVTETIREQVCASGKS